MKRITAVERVQRILTILPWLVENQGSQVDEVCQRFGIGRDELIQDLELVFYEVGLHPFTPDVLSEVLIDDDRITVNLGDYFHRPLRLSSIEAMKLLTAAKAQLRFGTVDDERREVLSRAVEKVSKVLGAEAGETFEVEFGSADQTMLGTFNEAIAARHSVLIRYYAYGRDELSERLVDPYRVTGQNGFWYLSAWCHKAGALREFRLDRIYSAVPTEQLFDMPTPPAEVPTGRLSDTPHTVEITGDSSIRWVSEMYPCDEVEELSDGRLRIVLPVTATRWLERLLLRLDPSIAVVDRSNGEDLRPLAKEAARRILGRYDTVPG